MLRTFPPPSATVYTFAESLLFDESLASLLLSLPPHPVIEPTTIAIDNASANHFFLINQYPPKIIIFYSSTNFFMKVVNSFVSFL